MEVVLWPLTKPGSTGWKMFTWRSSKHQSDISPSSLIRLDPLSLSVCLAGAGTHLGSEHSPLTTGYVTRNVLQPLLQSVSSQSTPMGITKPMLAGNTSIDIQRATGYPIRQSSGPPYLCGWASLYLRWQSGHSNPHLTRASITRGEESL